MNSINLGGDILELRVVGADEALEKLNELEVKLKEVRALTEEITYMTVGINFFEVGIQTDDPKERSKYER